MNKTAEAVVIGGGVNGSSIAFHLARSGMKNVVLVEKGHIASGPTGRSSGIVRQHYTIRTLAEMARDSLRVFQNFAEEVGGGSGFVQSGGVFSCGANDAPALRNTVAMHQTLGIRAEVLSVQQIQDMEPGISPHGIALAAYEPDAGYADPSLTANSFAQAAEAQGVQIFRKTEVTAIRTNTNRVEAVQTTAGEITTHNIINAAGPWSDRISAMVGLELPLRATRHPVVLLQRPPSWRTPTPVWLDLVEGWYFKPERSPTLMVGSLDVGHDQRVDLTNYATAPSYEETEQYSEAALRRFPVLSEGLAQGGWAGLYDVTPDGQPVIDRVSGLDGFYFAAGFSGHGFKLSPSVGLAVTELVTKGRSETYDLSPFRFTRFRDDQLTRSAYEYSIVG
ncbi:MAG: FAD-binding oxidoreductase [Bryobacteraceae bacterium]